ncbi:hypothetical protein HYPSUDRAFT_914307 [Hypholoma sublateritium FD-334 SS-4]|uniref:Uncharacterized protein n=1 Tax=Hypholoma sublateritium (strain FD-334 SS-4) TaxID=945553 RepID=A0A0D2M6M9_HYPSF|nr:hypothetical protein HYPSUDRAFT_914307 [Hypholoma sublateritium FD-334 SS-4]
MTCSGPFAQFSASRCLSVFSRIPLLRGPACDSRRNVASRNARTPDFRIPPLRARGSSFSAVEATSLDSNTPPLDMFRTSSAYERSSNGCEVRAEEEQIKHVTVHLGSWDRRNWCTSCVYLG